MLYIFALFGVWWGFRRIKTTRAYEEAHPKGRKLGENPFILVVLTTMMSVLLSIIVYYALWFMNIIPHPETQLVASEITNVFAVAEENVVSQSKNGFVRSGRAITCRDSDNDEATLQIKYIGENVPVEYILSTNGLPVDTAKACVITIHYEVERNPVGKILLFTPSGDSVSRTLTKVEIRQV